MEKGKYILSAFLLLVVLTSSLYFVMNDDLRIDIQETRSIFKVQIDGKWVVSGIEYVNLFDGTAKMRASERTLDVETYGNDTIVTRTAQYKNNILVVETYIFQSNTSDITLFPISHDIRVIGADRPERPYILQYEVQKLLYTGITRKDVNSPQSFGNNMKVEWEDGNYYSRVYKYADKDEGKLTVRYRINESIFDRNVRLFDPPGEPFTITEKTKYGFSQNTIYVNITENFKKNQYINISHIFNDNYFTDQIKYLDIQSLQQVEKEQYGFVNTTTLFKYFDDIQTNSTTIRKYYDNDDEEIQCQYPNEQLKTCFNEEYIVIGTHFAEEFSQLTPDKKVKTKQSSGDKLKHSQQGIYLEKES
jgi:hypothetical protein